MTTHEWLKTCFLSLSVALIALAAVRSGKRGPDGKQVELGRVESTCYLGLFGGVILLGVAAAVTDESDWLAKYDWFELMCMVLSILASIRLCKPKLISRAEWVCYAVIFAVSAFALEDESPGILIGFYFVFAVFCVCCAADESFRDSLRNML